MYSSKMAYLRENFFSCQTKILCTFLKKPHFFPFPSLQSHLYEHPPAPFRFTIYYFLILIFFWKKNSTVYTTLAMSQLVLQPPKISYVQLCSPNPFTFISTYPSTLHKNTISFLRAGLTNAHSLVRINLKVFFYFYRYEKDFTPVFHHRIANVLFYFIFSSIKQCQPLSFSSYLTFSFWRKAWPVHTPRCVRCLYDLGEIHK
ncbi:hypothetical protein L873DRAFT_21496 [Choiromyces venosus 120613-1]|uniref:Uncharacterized protein n=1 Tax=Choiromyces venosus 120613-1 TaxID=1336337 RepID=A0A3N4KCG3_9PEZI|nr:hypothetical protein L873DRAFT_21496 [Choiromyces venosus 120613-1]